MANGTKIRRIKAKEAEVVKSPPKAKKPAKKAPKAEKKAKISKNTDKKTRKINIKTPKWLKTIGRFFGKIFGPLGKYFKGAWQELRATIWPNRKATWGLTVAVIAFSIVFAILVLSFDNLFQWLIQQILNLGGN